MSSPGGDGWSEGHDGRRRIYRERLYPPIAVFVLVVGLAAIVGIAYGAAYGAAWGWGFGALIACAGVGVLIATSTPLHVDERVVRAGRARLPVTAIAAAHPLDSDGMRHARRHGDPRDYVVLRAWSSRRGVAVDISDARDPHPRWVITSRRPEKFCEAIRQASATATPTSADG
jgi:hypothetical protein